MLFYCTIVFKSLDIFCETQLAKNTHKKNTKSHDKKTNYQAINAIKLDHYYFVKHH